MNIQLVRTDRTTVADGEPWQYWARCRGRLSLFFPGGDGSRVTHQQAVRVCTGGAGCPVQAQCLELAMRAEGNASTESRYGVYGALTPEQRHALHKARVAEITAQLAHRHQQETPR